MILLFRVDAIKFSPDFCISASHDEHNVILICEDERNLLEASENS